MPEEIVDPTVVSVTASKDDPTVVLDPITPADAKVVDEPKVFDAEYVKSLREEAARHRVEKQKEATRSAELEAKLKEYEDAKLSVEEKQTRDFEETKTLAATFMQKALESDLKYQLALAAKDEGITDIRAAVKLADRELIEMGDDGSISNIADVIANLKAEYTTLFSSTPNAPHTGTSNPAKAPSDKKYTIADLGKLSPEKRVELLESGALKHLL